MEARRWSTISLRNQSLKKAMKTAASQVNRMMSKISTKTSVTKITSLELEVDFLPDLEAVFPSREAFNRAVIHKALLKNKKRRILGLQAPTQAPTKRRRHLRSSGPNSQDLVSHIPWRSKMNKSNGC